MDTFVCVGYHFSTCVYSLFITFGYVGVLRYGHFDKKMRYPIDIYAGQVYPAWSLVFQIEKNKCFLGCPHVSLIDRVYTVSNKCFHLVTRQIMPTYVFIC